VELSQSLITKILADEITSPGIGLDIIPQVIHMNLFHPIIVFPGNRGFVDTLIV
jgi:hypothetical protein